jgi:hypothetical protein
MHKKLIGSSSTNDVYPSVVALACKVCMASDEHKSDMFYNIKIPKY